MKPFESILSAVIFTITLFITICVLNEVFSPPIEILLIFSYLVYFLGGVLAIGLSEKCKIRYGLYYGIIIALIQGLFKMPLSALLIIILGTLGGFMMAMTNENYRLSFFNKHEFNFSPIIAVIIGIVITFACFFLLVALWILSGYTIVSGHSGILFVFIAISLIVGSFTSTFVSKEKKIQYGIYSATIFVIYKSFFYLTNMSSIQSNYLVTIIIIVYMLSAFIGSYSATKNRDLHNRINRFFKHLLR